MFKRILILCAFIAFFALAAWLMFGLQNKATSGAVSSAPRITEEKALADDLHSYTLSDIQTICSSNDKIFCAVERTVKCTLAPELEGCNKENVPSFVVGKTEDVDRPTEMSFRIVKIKPIPESSDISVYTESDCNAMWFGLCKGTVVYSLSPKEEGEWGVTNVFALE